MRPGLLIGGLWRESRDARGRLAFFLGCLAVGVSAVVGVAAVVAAIEDGLRAQSRQLLGADLAVRSRAALPEAIEALLADEPGLERTDVLEMASLVAAPPEGDAPGRSRLAELLAIDGRYPLYGELGLDPAVDLAELGPDGVVVAPELLRTLGLDVGDELRVGGEPFRVVAAVTAEPDRLDVSFQLAPRVLLSRAGLERTPLVQFGSRVRYRTLLRAPPGWSVAEVAGLGADLRGLAPDASGVRVETSDQAQPAVRRGLRNMERFLGLVALLSLLLGGVGVAQVVRAWIASRTPSVAVLRCLGVRPREILAMYIAHVVGLAAVGSLLGAVLGSLLPLVLPIVAADLVPAELVHPFQPLAWLKGLGLGVGVAVLFSLPPLVGLWRVSPARVLRAEAEPLPPPRAVRFGATAAWVLGLFASAWLQAGRLDVAAGFAGGLLVLGGLLFLGARGLMGLAGRLPRERFGPRVVHAVAALGRPSAGTVGAVVALGLGAMVVVAMQLVETRLAGELENALPEDAPTVFLVDVQPDQWADVEGALAAGGASRIDSVPVVMARLKRLDGRPVEDIAEERRSDAGGRGRARWVLTREQRLTWLEELPEDNEIVAGALWSDPERHEVSIEVDFAEDLGVEVGSEIVFDLQGVEVPVVVTSLRTVDWRTFGLNFFLVLEPGALVGAPGFRIAAARLPAASEAGVQDAIAAAHPNVTMLPIRPVLEKVLAIMRRLALAVRVLGGFTVVTGLVILAGVVASNASHRGREVALLKTLGATRRGVALLFAVEFALMGLVAGAVGSSGAFALAWAFLERVVELEAELPVLAIPFGAVTCALLAATAGVLACVRSLAAQPIESLRA